MQFQGMAPVALIPLSVLPLISLGQVFSLWHVAQMQTARNGNIIVGNLGVVTTGAQTASPVNVASH